jgi:hypothetical protein
MPREVARFIDAGALTQLIDRLATAELQGVFWRTKRRQAGDVPLSARQDAAKPGYRHSA